MNIISHRGYWKFPEEKNTELAFRRSFDVGFGIETDIRDCAGSLVVSHDPPVGGEMSFRQLLSIRSEYGNGLPLALNVKADGLQSAVVELLAEYATPEFFFFDMAVPDALEYLHMKLPIYSRHSDIEICPILYESAIGVWLDSFGPDWVSDDVIEQHLRQGKHVCMVSPELHGRDRHEFWHRLSKWHIISHPNLCLCTDYPEEAREILS